MKNLRIEIRDGYWNNATAINIHRSVFTFKPHVRRVQSVLMNVSTYTVVNQIKLNYE